MSITTPGDNVRCDHCDRPGEPYTYKGQTFSGLTANRGERLCPPCRDRVVARDGVDILTTNRAGTASFVYNTTADRDRVIPANPEYTDGRDLAARHARRRTRRH